jgi:hypothetical protein
VLLLDEAMPSGWLDVIPALFASVLLVWGTITLGRLAPDHGVSALPREPLSISS